MWHDIVQLDVSTVEKLVRPVLIYGFLVIALRLAGKRELAQLNSLDFVVLLAVANAVRNGIIGDDDSVTGGVLGASALSCSTVLSPWCCFGGPSSGAWPKGRLGR
ncbi:MAG TPA: hypothetical protein VE623_25555 [Acidimicrobiales bacterium]|nr:hypothetical protein [Acidimicrobiales bacterium]